MDNITPQAIDFPHLAKLLWTEADYFPGLETAVIEQIGHALFPLVRQQDADGFPHLASLVGIFHQRFSCFAWLWQGYLFWS